MDQDNNIKMFQELTAKLFDRVEAGFAAFRTEEPAVGIRGKTPTPLRTTLGLVAVLEEEILRHLPRAKGGEVEYFEPEDQIFQPGPDLSTSMALRDELCKLFPDVVVCYLLCNETAGAAEVKTRWVGSPFHCLGLLRCVSFNLRTSTPEVFGDASTPEEYETSVLEIKENQSGQIILISGPNVLDAAGCAALALGQAAEIVLGSTGVGDP
jgi:hypothetical protein